MGLQPDRHGVPRSPNPTRPTAGPRPSTCTGWLRPAAVAAGSQADRHRPPKGLRPTLAWEPMTKWRTSTGPLHEHQRRRMIRRRPFAEATTNEIPTLHLLLRDARQRMPRRAANRGLHAEAKGTWQKLPFRTGEPKSGPHRYRWTADSRRICPARHAAGQGIAMTGSNRCRSRGWTENHIRLGGGCCQVVLDHRKGTSQDPRNQFSTTGANRRGHHCDRGSLVWMPTLPSGRPPGDPTPTSATPQPTPSDLPEEA